MLGTVVREHRRACKVGYQATAPSYIRTCSSVTRNPPPLCISTEVRRWVPTSLTQLVPTCLHSRVLLCALVIKLQLRCPPPISRQADLSLPSHSLPSFPWPGRPFSMFELVPSVSVHLNLTSVQRLSTTRLSYFVWQPPLRQQATLCPPPCLHLWRRKILYLFTCLLFFKFYF